MHLTGTNGKTSTSRMIDALLRALELRTGRFTSPHVERMNERISVDGEPLDDEAFVRAFNDVAPYTHMVDEDQPHPLSFFETVVGMAYAAFADAPVDVAVVEVGMGGSWDATNVIDADVAVVLPIAVDHAKYLGGTPEAIASEKSGIVKAGSVVVSAAQDPEVDAVLVARVAEVGASLLREGVDFGVSARTPAVGGQIVTLEGLRGRYEDLFLPLYGAHQAQNAAIALATVEALVGGKEPLDGELVAAAFADVTSPARLENSFTFDPLVGVLGVMADKDAEGLLVALEPVLSHVVVTQCSTDRAMRAEALGEAAIDVFGEERVTVVPRLADAIEAAATLAEAGESVSASIGAGAVLVTGSVVTAGEARTLLTAGRRTPGAEERS